MDNFDYTFDQRHLWHPYSSMAEPAKVFAVAGAQGAKLTLSDGRQLVDGTSSWWACIHGYSHPQIIAAMGEQLQQLSHVMFGGISHTPAVELGKQLLALVPPSLTKIFYADSGSIAVEVALKMALQYWQGQAQPQKQRILTIRHGYHGDTFAAMSVCDPDEGMHSMFSGNVIPQIFAPAPKAPWGSDASEDLAELERVLKQHHQQIAALILEPIMQGAGAMFFYSADYLRAAQTLCRRYRVLLIVDEIATGFGRTGKLFACEHAEVTPDIMCIGKALSGGYISLAATLCSDEVAQGISQSPAGVFMHGPTFMANPLACRAAMASLALISTGAWRQQVANIERQLLQQLAPAKTLSTVKDLRVLGTVAVLEMYQPVNTAQLQQEFVQRGVWVRPFSRFIYIMPPYIISHAELTQLTDAMLAVAALPPTLQADNTVSHG